MEQANEPEAKNIGSLWHLSSDHMAYDIIFGTGTAAGTERCC